MVSGWAITPRPVDAFPVPADFRHTRIEALRLGCCCRCGFDVSPSDLTAIDAKEYQISALCPRCTAEFEALFAQMEEKCE